MSLTSAIKAGDAFFEIMAEDKTAKGIDSAEKRLRRFSAYVGGAGIALMGFGAAALTSFGVMLRSFASAGDEISDAMNVTGLSSDFLQTLQFGAADAGVSFNALIGSLTKMNVTLSKAAAKGKDVLGLDAKQLLQLEPDKRVLALVDALEKIKDPAQRAAAAVSVFGKSGAKLLPAFEGGAEALTDAMKEMKANGTIMSDEDRQLAVQTEGAFLSLGLMFTRITQIIAAAVAPAFLWLADVMRSGLEMAIKFLNNNRGLVAALAIGAGVITAVGAGLVGLGVAGVVASFAVTGLSIALAALGFLVSPAFLIGAALVTCGIAAGVAAYQLDKVHNSGKGFAALKEGVEGTAEAFGILQTAIVNGKWGLAGDFIMASLNHAFLGGVVGLKGIWSDFTTWMVTSAIETSLRVADALGELFPGAAAGARQMGEELKANVRQDAMANQAEDQQGLLAAALEVTRIAAEIGAPVEKKKLKDFKFDFDNIAESASGSLMKVQTVGAMSSAAAARLNSSAPGNQWQDKTLSQLEKQTELQEEIRDGIDDLELGTTVE